MVFLAAGTGWYYLRDRVAALLMGTFVAAETMFIVYSRAGLMDGILTFFVLATMLSAWRTGRTRDVVLTAVLFGLTVAVKWAAAPLVIPAGYVMWRRGYLRQFVGSLYISVLVYLFIVYVGQLINHDHNPLQAFVDIWRWHIKAAEQITRAVPNTEASEWWAWPLMIR
jgi:dolichyl-phosphate-mannose--protein O-mannosyl transferase